MRLSDYLREKKTTAVAFADRIGRAPSTVTRILSGQHTPDAATMRAIIEATDGAVSPNDFFDLPGGAPPPDADGGSDPQNGQADGSDLQDSAA